MRFKTALLVLAPAALILQMTPAWATCGSAYFNQSINWPDTQPLYFYVSGAPANTCGDLYADRNGSGYVLNAANWICTNGSGNATAGPWSSNPDDETASVYIDWGSCESPVATHIWDVGHPDVTINSGIPGSFTGSADDEAWGAGFAASWSNCAMTFHNDTTGLWWSTSTGSYSSSTEAFVPCTLFGMPSLNIDWAANNIPDGPDHVSSQHYTWLVAIYDGYQWNEESAGFTY